MTVTNRLVAGSTTVGSTVGETMGSDDDRRDLATDREVTDRDSTDRDATDQQTHDDGRAAPGGPTSLDGSASADQSWSWHLMRASAIALIVLLPVHLASFHLTSGTLPFTESQLYARWTTPWRLIDWLTLTLALVHGAIALQPPVPTAHLASSPQADGGELDALAKDPLEVNSPLAADAQAETVASASNDVVGLPIPFLRRFVGTTALVAAAVGIGSLTYVVFTYRLVG